MPRCRSAVRASSASASTSAVAVLAAALVAASAFGQNPPSWPQAMTPAQAGIAYDIVACRAPVANSGFRNAFPDAVNYSLYAPRGTDLVLIHPNGTEEVLVAAGPNGACVDPVVTYDGRAVLFAKFDDPQNINVQRGLSWNPSHIFRVDLATRQVTQLTSGSQVAWQDSAHQIDPLYAKFDVAPLELPDGRILFLSNRDGTMDAESRFPAMKFWRMDRNGRNVEPMENFTQGSCQHPFILRDGRVVWTHRHDTGRRSLGGGNYPLMVAGQDLGDFKVFAGAHRPDSAWHFGTQLADGDVVVCVYYHQNNYGHGTLVRFPAHSGHPSGNDFHGVSPSSGTWNNYGVNDHYMRVGETLATPWTLYGALNYGSLSADESSPLMPDGSRAGKCTMPAAAPGGNLLLVWSHGNVNDLNRPTPELPHMKVCLAPGGSAPLRQQMIVLKESATWHYLYPRPVVTYAAIHGIPRPAVLPETSNDGAATPALPAGAPYATTGTSSVYNRESRWPPSYNDPWDVNIVNNYALGTAFFNVGQDSYAFANGEIWAAQVVADMSHIDRRYATLAARLRSHNNGNQVWGVLGEIPLRKFQPGGAPLLDPQGNPDTSYEVRIPADVPFHNRLVDRNGLMLTAEWTWHSARPGERKTNCGGCHAHSVGSVPLDFAQTAAAAPGAPIADFALQTPMLTQDAQGNPAIAVRPEKVRVVEYHRDVKPILDAKCAGCHGDVNPAAGLDLQGADAWNALAYVSGSLYGHHQATRWVRRHAATQSLLVWKAFGQRLDGRTNAARAGDVDYTGDPMPPPSSPVPPLTFDEKRTLALWIDLGCLVDLVPSGPAIGDPFDDQMKPVLAVQGPRGYVAGPLPPLRLGVYDLHSGIDPASLQVRVAPPGQPAGPNLASGLAVADGQAVTIPLPALPAAQWHRIQISVRDLAGNISRREISFASVPPAAAATTGTGSPGTGGLVPLLAASGPPRLGTPDFAVRVEQALPGAAVHLFFAYALAPQPWSIGPGLLARLDPVDLAQLFAAGLAPLASGTVDPSGVFALPLAVPDDPALSGFAVHFQALVVDPAGAPLSGASPPLAVALTAALSLTLGG